MTDMHRRRVDIVLDSGYTDALDKATPDELRAKLRDAKTEEDAISYVRRNLHGHLDLLRSELDLRRDGAVKRDAQTLAAALTTGKGNGNGKHGRGAHAGLALRASAVAGRREGERVLLEDHLARLPDLSDEEIGDVVDRVTEAERRMSDDRQRLHAVIDALEAELANRYKAGLEPSLDRLR